MAREIIEKKRPCSFFLGLSSLVLVLIREMGVQLDYVVGGKKGLSKAAIFSTVASFQRLFLSRMPCIFEERGKMMLFSPFQQKGSSQHSLERRNRYFISRICGSDREETISSKIQAGFSLEGWSPQATIPNLF